MPLLGLGGKSVSARTVRVSGLISSSVWASSPGVVGDAPTRIVRICPRALNAMVPAMLVIGLSNPCCTA